VVNSGWHQEILFELFSRLRTRAERQFVQVNNFALVDKANHNDKTRDRNVHQFNKVVTLQKLDHVCISPG
jgi:hypothetical protein